MYLTNILHPVQAKEPPKVKKLKIGVARKLDLIEPNWVYSFLTFIRRYQTRIVSSMLVSMIFNLLDRVYEFKRKTKWKSSWINLRNLWEKLMGPHCNALVCAAKLFWKNWTLNFFLKLVWFSHIKAVKRYLLIKSLTLNSSKTSYYKGFQYLFYNLT